MRHGGYYSGPDRYKPGKLIKHKWESATTVDRNAWAHRKNLKLEDIADMQVINKIKLEARIWIPLLFL